MQVDNQQITQIRTERGWTQQHLADACAVSLRTIQRVEKDGIASTETVAALCSVFEVERQQLLTEEGAVKPTNNSKRSAEKPVWLEALPMLITLLAGMAIGISLTLWLTGR